MSEGYLSQVFQGRIQDLEREIATLKAAHADTLRAADLVHAERDEARAEVERLRGERDRERSFCWAAHADKATLDATAGALRSATARLVLAENLAEASERYRKERGAVCREEYEPGDVGHKAYVRLGSVEGDYLLALDAFLASREGEKVVEHVENIEVKTLCPPCGGPHVSAPPAKYKEPLLGQAWVSRVTAGGGPEEPVLGGGLVYPPDCVTPSAHGSAQRWCVCPGCKKPIPACWATPMCTRCADEDCEHGEASEPVRAKYEEPLLGDAGLNDSPYESEPQQPRTHRQDPVTLACVACSHDAGKFVRWPCATPEPPAPQHPKIDREFLGQVVRLEWIAWAKEQPAPKASWLQSWEELTEPEREVDRRIGERVVEMVFIHGQTPAPQDHAAALAEALRESLRFVSTVSCHAYLKRDAKCPCCESRIRSRAALAAYEREAGEG